MKESCGHQRLYAQKKAFSSVEICHVKLILIEQKQDWFCLMCGIIKNKILAQIKLIIEDVITKTLCDWP